MAHHSITQTQGRTWDRHAQSLPFPASARLQHTVSPLLSDEASYSCCNIGMPKLTGSLGFCVPWEKDICRCLGVPWCRSCLSSYLKHGRHPLTRKKPRRARPRIWRCEARREKVSIATLCCVTCLLCCKLPVNQLSMVRWTRPMCTESIPCVWPCRCERWEWKVGGDLWYVTCCAEVGHHEKSYVHCEMFWVFEMCLVLESVEAVGRFQHVVCYVVQYWGDTSWDNIILWVVWDDEFCHAYYFIAVKYYETWPVVNCYNVGRHPCPKFGWHGV